MRKHKQEVTEYIPEWDAGTYHTGSAKPPKRSNGLVTGLLIAVICLGGLASAFGALNFRLLSSMMEQGGDPVTPLDTHATPVASTTANAFLDNQEHPAPSIPANRNMQLQISTSREEMTAEEIYSRNERSLVSVYATTHGSQTQSGTGIALSEDGYILTNAHILEGAQRIFIYLSDGHLVRAAVVGADPFTDLAVLYVQADGLVPALFAKAASLQPEDPVHALKDQPDADHNFLLSGAFYSLAELSTGDLTLQVLQSSLWGTHGPVFDDMGRIVGIQAGKISRYFDCEAQGLAIPCETMLAVVTELIENGRMEGRPALGIQVAAISRLYQHYWELPGGLLVTQINENSNAALQGLEEGDILLTLDGIQLTSRADLYATLYQAQIGDELTAAVFRDGRKFTITLIVEEMEG